MVETQQKVCEYVDQELKTAKNLEEYLNETVPIAKEKLEDLLKALKAKTVKAKKIAVCKHKKKWLSKGYKITKVGYLNAIDLKLESPTLKVDANIEDEYYEKGAVFVDERGQLHIIEYFKTRLGYYAVDKGVYSVEQVARLLAKAYAESVGPHPSFFVECVTNKINAAKSMYKLN